MPVAHHSKTRCRSYASFLPQLQKDELDPFIQPAVEAFNRIPGVATRFSCQGISGQITFQGRDLLVVSEHEKYAYVSFCKLGQWAHDALVARLPDFPSITVSRTPRLELRSTGDNLRFREDMVILAQKLLDNVDESWNDLPEDSSLDGKFVVHSVPLPQDSSLPGGLLPSRLIWLCEQEQIERTLHLLFHLNHRKRICRAAYLSNGSV